MQLMIFLPCSELFILSTSTTLLKSTDMSFVNICNNLKLCSITTKSNEE